MFTLALLTALSVAPADTARPLPRSIPELEARIQEILDSSHTPAVSVALVSRDRVLWTAGLGFANVAARRPATERTLFRIGSTSKAFTSLAVMQLVEEGRLSLDDPLSRYLPEIAFRNRWEASDPVRVANALEHSTGFDDWAFRDYANSDPTPLTLRQGLDFNPTTRVSRWRPGTRVAYCNSGPPLGAYVVEKLTGQPFDRFAEERLFRPIGMPTATYLPPDTSVVDAATLYHGDGVTPFPYWHVLMRPAGSINASAIDMAAYVRLLLNRGMVDGRPLVSAASVERMERSERSLTATAGLTVGYGLHLGRYVDSSFVWVGHDGGVSGGLTNMAYLPDAGVGFAFMINSGNGPAYAQLSQLIRGYLTQSLPRPARPPRAPLSPLARRYAGWYQSDNPRVQRFYFLERLALSRVRVTDTSLVIDPVIGKAETLLPVAERTFRGPTEPVATLALIDDSADDRPVAIERMGYLLPTSLVRIPTALAWLEIALAALWVVVVALTVIVTVVKLLRFLIRKLRRRPTLRPTTGLFWWPFSTTVALGVSLALLLVALNSGDAGALGTRTAVYLGLFAGFLSYGLLALGGAGMAVLRPREAGPVARWAGNVAALIHLVAAGYLTWWGVIGWRPWA